MTTTLEVVRSTPRPYFTPGKEPVPIVQEAGWAPGSVWTGGKSRPTGIRSPDCPARSQSLYRLSYPTHTHTHTHTHIYMCVCVCVCVCVYIYIYFFFFFHHSATTMVKRKASSLMMIHDDTQLHTPHSVGLLWMSDQPNAETST